MSQLREQEALVLLCRLALRDIPEDRDEMLRHSGRVTDERDRPADPDFGTIGLEVTGLEGAVLRFAR